MQRVPHALPPVTPWTDYWIALQTQYAATEAFMQLEGTDVKVTMNYINACNATRAAWERVLKGEAA